MNKLTLPIGQSDFRTIRASGSYYIDKTGYISRIIRDGATSIKFTRPRRFGKTTFQSMLRAFFDIREDNQDIFNGLEIMKDRDAVENWMNKRPVIFLSFKDIDGLDFESAIDILRGKLSSLYKGYAFIDIQDDENGRIFRDICRGKCSVSDIRRSLEVIAGLLCSHYGRKVIFILDEYDVPLDKAERNGYYRQMLDVVRSMFLSVLKDCPYTEKGILTGCLRISKESLFTGLNNLRVFSVTSDKYCSAFGFTEDEVSRLLHDAGLEDKAETIRKWYDGYSIGSMSIYSPWDVILCVDSLLSNPDAKPENYWANSSGNDAIRRLIDMTDAEVGDDYSTLINGGIIRKKLNETLTYNNLYSSPDNIWSLFLMTGYLTLAGEYDANEENALRLPNEEIRRLFASSVDEWFSDKVMNSSRKELFDALWSRDATALSEIISQYLFDTISYYDYREDYYHAFLAGLLSGAGYIVKSNRETGTGRADIMIRDKKNRRAAVFEVKRSPSKDAMDMDAERAIRQVDSRKYGKDLDGFRAVMFYGAAFFEKEVLIKVTVQPKQA